MSVLTLLIVNDDTVAQDAVTSLRRRLLASGVSEDAVLVVRGVSVLQVPKTLPVAVPALDLSVLQTEPADIEQLDLGLETPDVGGLSALAYVHPIVRGYYLDTGYERWMDLSDDSARRRIVRLVRQPGAKYERDGRKCVVFYRDEHESEYAPPANPTSIGRKPFLERFMPIPGADPMPGIPVKALAAIRAADPEAWKSAAVPAAISRALDEPAYEGLDKLLDEDEGLTDEEHAELDEGVAELEPERIPLGALGEGVLPEDQEMIRKIIRITGWYPVIGMRAEGVHTIRYRVHPQSGDDAWLDRTHEQTEGRKEERLTLALRAVLRNVNQDHKRDL